MKHEQVTAWALDELTPEERALVDAELKEDATAQQQAADTREFCDFLTTHLFDPSVALEDEQRAALLKAAASEPSSLQALPGASPAATPPQMRRSSVRRAVAVISTLAAAAAIVLTFVMSGLVVRNEGAPSQSASAPSPQSESKDIRDRGIVSLQSDEGLPTIQLQTAGAPDGLKRADLTASNLPFGPVAKAAPLIPEGQSFVPKQDVMSSSLANAPTLRLQETLTSPTAPPSATLKDASPLSRENLTVNGGTLAFTPESRSAGLGDSAMRTDDYAASVASTSTIVTGHVEVPGGLGKAEKAAPGAPSLLPAAPAAGAPAAVAGKPMDGYDGSSTTLALTTPPVELKQDAGGFANGGRKSGMDFDDSRPRGLGSIEELKREADLPALNEPVVRPNNESYTAIVENAVQDVARAPLSTFSIDVDTASYANVRRFLNQNSAPPPDAVRIEELINYFPTNSEGPAADAKDPFAVHVEMAQCPWQPQHRLARINIKGRELGNERKPSNLVFLVDVSGSMDAPNKLPLVQQSLRLLTEKLGEEDRVSMVVYAGSSGLVLPPTNGMNKAEIASAIDRLRAGGSTHGSAGIRLAYEQAIGGFIKGGVNRVILCTDGDFNVGISSPEELEKLITEKARSGVFLSVLGYGTGNLKDRTMETLADKGNGNYAYIDSLSEARKVLVEQMSGTLVTIAKDVKIQVEFNPRVIRGYRLIGYENRLLAKEDFNDDTKDAGEIGAGHTVTALYELIPASLAPGEDPRPLVDDLKYQPRPAVPAAAPAPEPTALTEAQANEALTVKLRYKEPEGSTSRLIEVPVKDDAKRIDAASGEYQFTAAVAGFGLLLRHSSYAGNLTWEQVRELAQHGKGTDPNGYRGEFLQLIDKARSVSGR